MFDTSEPEVVAPKNCILVRLDPVTQDVQIQFDTDDFKSWSYLIAVLRMAVDDAEMKRRFVQAEGIRKQQIEAAQRQAVAAQQAAVIQKKVFIAGR